MIVGKQITAILFMIAFLMQTFSMSFVVADYYTNTSKYAKNCVNKAKPKMRCNGKCQMMKKIQEEEKKEQENQERKADNKSILVLSSKSFFTTATFQKIQFIVSHYPVFKSPKKIDRSFEIFHPPSGFTTV